MQTVSEGDLSDSKSVNDTTTFDALASNISKMATEAKQMTNNVENVEGENTLSLNLKQVEEPARIPSSSLKPGPAADNSQPPQQSSSSLPKPTFTPDIVESLAPTAATLAVPQGSVTLVPNILSQII